MSEPVDSYGLPLTTTSSVAAARYREGIDLLLSSNDGAIKAFGEALGADPGFALAHLGCALASQVAGIPKDALKHTTLAVSLRAGATPRERSQVEVLRRFVVGRGADAIEQAAQHLREWPSDMLVAFLALGMLFFGGGRQKRQKTVALLEALAPALGDDWRFQGHFAFALMEVGRLDEAKELAERALAVNPRHADAMHTVAHVAYTRGERDGLLGRLEQWLVDYDPHSRLHGHLSWHVALCHLSDGHSAAAWDIYRDSIRPSVGGGMPNLTLADGAGFLWRCQLFEQPVAEEHWKELHELALSLSSLKAGDAAERRKRRVAAVLGALHRGTAGTRFQKASVVAGAIGNKIAGPRQAFIDVHTAFVLAGAGDLATLDRLRDRVQSWALKSQPEHVAVTVPIIDGIRAFARRDFAASARHLEPVLADLEVIGGSNIERELVEDTLIEALVRAGRAQDAVAALERRLEGRDDPRLRLSLGKALLAEGRGDVGRERLDEVERAWRPDDRSAERQLLSRVRQSVSA